MSVFQIPDLSGTYQTKLVSYRKTTVTTVNTTVAATDLLGGAITVAANALSATGMLRFTAFGDLLNNSGGAVNIPAFKVVLGGTTIFDTGTGVTVVNSAARRGWRFVCEILAANATNAQVANFTGNLSGSGTTGASFAFATGNGTMDNANSEVLYEAVNTSALDMTTSKTFVFNTVNGSASASYETKLFGALVEIL